MYHNAAVCFTAQGEVVEWSARDWPDESPPFTVLTFLVGDGGEAPADATIQVIVPLGARL